MPGVRRWTNTMKMRTSLFPTQNTLLYLPLAKDTIDHSALQIPLTTGWTTITYTTLNSGKSVASFSNSVIYTASNFISTHLSSHTYTVNFWCTVNKTQLLQRFQFCIWTNDNTQVEVSCKTQATNVWWELEMWYGSNQAAGWTSSFAWRNNICVVVTGWTAKMYVNATLYATATITTRSDWELGIGWLSTTLSHDRHDWYMSEFVLEKIARNESRITDNFNSTRANYWL